jgi:hypothetical protein
VAQLFSLGIVTRLRKISTIVSAVLCGLLVALCAASYCLNRSVQCIRVTPSFHLGFSDGGAYFFSHDQPWLDGIISLADTNAPKEVVRSWHIGDYYGFYHSSSVERHGADSGLLTVTIFNLPGSRFREVSYFWENRPIWTFLVSLWYPILLLAILPALWFYRRRHFGFGSHENDA